MPQTLQGGILSGHAEWWPGPKRYREACGLKFGVRGVLRQVRKASAPRLEMLTRASSFVVLVLESGHAE